jgi:hypothetical protein
MSFWLFTSCVQEIWQKKIVLILLILPKCFHVNLMTPCLPKVGKILFYISYERLLRYLWCMLGLRFTKPIMWEKIKLINGYLVQTPKTITIFYLCDHANSWHILFHLNIIIMQIILCVFLFKYLHSHFVMYCFIQLITLSIELSIS